MKKQERKGTVKKTLSPKSVQPSGTTTGKTARAVAVNALMRQAQDGYSNLILDAELKKNALPPRERAFASAIFYTVLEHRVTLDYILQQYLPKGVEKLDPPVREILRSGLAQARYMGVPVSAAVNEAVTLTRSFKKSSASGLVNAVLRRACGFDLEKAVFADETERLMVLGSAGRPLVEFLQQYYPEEALEILTQQTDNSLTAIRVNPLVTTPEALTEQLLQANAKQVFLGNIPNCLLVSFEGSTADNELFKKGYYHVEGQASQLAALCLGAKAGETVIDFCAAPGGKSIAIAEEMSDRGKLFSCDVTENRVRLIRSAIERMGLTSVEVCCNDASLYTPCLPQADRILADVPCSGLGILAKKPDIRYKSLDKAEMESLVALQAKILENAASYLKPGGRLVYSTCTINPQENQLQIEKFLVKHNDFTEIKSDNPIFNKMVTEGHGMLSLPSHSGMDGFYICVLEKALSE